MKLYTPVETFSVGKHEVTLVEGMCNCEIPKSMSSDCFFITSECFESGQSIHFNASPKDIDALSDLIAALELAKHWLQERL